MISRSRFNNRGLNEVGLPGGLLDRRRFQQALVAGAAACCLPRFSQAASLEMPQTFVYKQIADCQIKADVYQPKTAGKRPAVIWIHGGALIVGNRAGVLASVAERLVAAGCVLISIDYRLAPETKAPGILEDVVDACRWVRERGPELWRIDPEKIAITGGSAGGYLTLCCGFLVKPRPVALLPFWGYGDVASRWLSRPDEFYNKMPAVSREEALAAVGDTVLSEPPPMSNRGRFYLYCRQQGIWPQQVTGHDPDKEPEAFDAFCPLRNVDPEYPPTLFVHGDQDTDVPYEQSVLMAAELKRHGVEHELITVAGAGHGLSGVSAETTAPIYARGADFLLNHLAAGAP